MKQTFDLLSTSPNTVVMAYMRYKQPVSEGCEEQQEDGDKYHGQLDDDIEDDSAANVQTGSPDHDPDEDDDDCGVVLKDIFSNITQSQDNLEKFARDPFVGQVLRPGVIGIDVVYKGNSNSSEAGLTHYSDNGASAGDDKQSPQTGNVTIKKADLVCGLVPEVRQTTPYHEYITCDVHAMAG